MNYNAKYFRDNFPKWKKEKDSFLVRYFFRPLSFHGAAIAYKIRLTSNQVSFLSLLVAVMASVLFLINNQTVNIIGAILVVVWMVMDCVDGNLARSIKSYPYGDFIDAISSYTLIAMLFPCLGANAYSNGGLIIPAANQYIILIGAFTGLFDALARLFYQKYLNNKSIYDAEKTEKEEKTEGRLSKLNDRIGKEFGLNGLLIPFLFIAIIFRMVDIFVMVYFCFYGLRFLLSFLALINRTKCLKR